MLKNQTNTSVDYSKLEINDLMWYLVFKLYDFSDIITKAKENYDPSIIAKYAIDLAQDFNKFYGNEKIIEDNLNNTEFKLNLALSVSLVLKESLRILGLNAPEKM